METTLSKGARIVVIAQMPPPVTGLAVMNAAMVQAFETANLACKVLDVAPRAGARGVRKVIGRLWRVLVSAAMLLQQRRKGVRVLYMPSDASLGILFNIGLMLVARSLGYSVWIHHHNFSYLTRRSGLMASLLRLAPRGTNHIALCDRMLERLKMVYLREWEHRNHQGQVVSNAFILDIDDAPLQRAGKLTIGHLSNLTVEKGAVRFVDLFLRLRREGHDVVARMAGPIGDLESAAAIKTATESYPEDFVWQGPLYGEAKVDFYQTLDAFVFPTDYVNEAQPLVLFEALAGGAAVLVTDRGCIGCDHRDSPGIIASVEELESAAVKWVRDLDVGERLGLPAAAAGSAQAAKTTADAQLAGLLENFQTTSRRG